MPRAEKLIADCTRRISRGQPSDAGSIPAISTREMVETLLVLEKPGTSVVPGFFVEWRWWESNPTCVTREVLVGIGLHICWSRRAWIDIGATSGGGPQDTGGADTKRLLIRGSVGGV